MYKHEAYLNFICKANGAASNYAGSVVVGET